MNHKFNSLSPADESSLRGRDLNCLKNNNNNNNKNNKVWYVKIDNILRNMWNYSKHYVNTTRVIITCMKHWKTSPTVWKFSNLFSEDFQKISRIFPYYGIGQNYGNRIFQPFSIILPKNFQNMEEVRFFQWNVKHTHAITTETNKQRDRETD